MNASLVMVMIISWIGALGIPACALIYFRHVRVQLPPVGVFNDADLLGVMIGIIVIPLIYLALPSWLLTVVLALVLANLLFQGLRPLLPVLASWVVMLSLIGANLLTALGMHNGWYLAGPAHWITNDVVIFLAVITAANFAVQSGMRVRHLALLTLFLACYDGFFAWVIPLTPLLINHVAGSSFDPVFGFAIGNVQSFFGMGDLFTFALVATSAYKAFGKGSFAFSFPLIVICGIFLPTFGFSWVATLLGHGPLTLVPVQVAFGPTTCLVSWWLARRAPEQRMRHWLALPQKA